jgi:hypothetical protein
MRSSARPSWTAASGACRAARTDGLVSHSHVAFLSRPSTAARWTTSLHASTRLASRSDCSGRCEVRLTWRSSGAADAVVVTRFVCVRQRLQRHGDGVRADGHRQDAHAGQPGAGGRVGARHRDARDGSRVDARADGQGGRVQADAVVRAGERSRRSEAAHRRATFDQSAACS